MSASGPLGCLCSFVENIEYWALIDLYKDGLYLLKYVEHNHQSVSCGSMQHSINCFRKICQNLHKEYLHICVCE